MSEQALDKLVARQAEVFGDIAKDTVERPNPQRIVTLHSDVVLAGLRRRQANMTAGLARLLVAERTKRLDKVPARELAR